MREQEERRGPSSDRFLEFVVVAIAAIVFVALFLVTPKPWHGMSASEARTAKAWIDLRKICDASLAFYTRNERWPNDLTELSEWARSDPTEPRASVPRDGPWFSEYGVEFTECGVAATCYGKDGKPGGDGVDADIVVSRSLPPTE